MVSSPKKQFATRLMLVAVLWLGVGMLLNVATAWALFWRFRGVDPFLIAQSPRVPDWPRPAPGDWPQRGEAAFVKNSWWGQSSSVIAYPKVSRSWNGSTYPVLVVGMNWDDTGFPFRSVIFVRSNEVLEARGQGYPHLELGHEVALKLPIVGWVDFPTTPLWPGFALNTIFYAALAWGVWQVPLAIRRRRRRGRGLCIRCGYDRAGLAGGAVCPECGLASSGPAAYAARL